MRIYFRDGHEAKVRRIYIPNSLISLSTSITTWVLFSRGRGIDLGGISKEKLHLTKEQRKELKAMVRYLIKNYKGLTIVDIETKDEVVKIVI